MILKSLEYSQQKGGPNEWVLKEFIIGKINLIVGKNAIGKTMILNIIKVISSLLAGEPLCFKSGTYRVVFDNKGEEVEYTLGVENKSIYKEELKINGQTFLNRGTEGIGKIYAKQLNDTIQFQAPVNELACVARRDSVQHPFFEDLYQWGKTTYHYYFGSQLGKDILAVFAKDSDKENINLKQTEKVVGFYKRGVNKYGSVFVESIKKDMGVLGYKIAEISLGPLSSVEFGPNINPEGLHLKEENILADIDQLTMSQGMFRALSLIIQITLSLLESTPSCILIDDIGEGLDFDRSSKLVKLLVERTEQSKIQLIMSTNDKFIMNSIPLEYWGVVDRRGHICRVLNYTNSKKIFDDFAFTGLANFDFLSTEFYLEDSDKK